MDNIDSVIIELLSNARKSSCYDGFRYYFEGDLRQMATAKKAADEIGIISYIDGGVPFVTSEEDFKKITNFLKSNK
jgi:hypothetical protein